MNIFEEFFSCSIIEELFNSRFDELESTYIKSFKDRKETLTCMNYESELTKIIEENINDNTRKNEIIKKLNMLEMAMLSDLSESVKRAYKLGFVDGIKMNKEVKEIVEESKNGV